MTEKIQAEIHLLDLEKIHYWSGIFYKFTSFIGVSVFIIATITKDIFPLIVCVPLLITFFFLPFYLGRINQQLGFEIKRFYREVSKDEESVVKFKLSNDIISDLNSFFLTFVIMLFSLMIVLVFIIILCL